MKMIFSSLQKSGEKQNEIKQEKLKANLDNHDLCCIWLGYVTSHAMSMYQVPNLKMKNVLLIM